MKLKKFREYLRDIYNKGYGSYVLNFEDQDYDCYTITNIYADNDGDICLVAGDGDSYSAEKIYNELRNYVNAYIYIYAPYTNEITLDIEGGWYLDDEGYLTMDVTYENDYDDDDYDDDDYWNDSRDSQSEENSVDEAFWLTLEMGRWSKDK